jgi:hypothetical protein
MSRRGAKAVNFYLKSYSLSAIIIFMASPDIRPYQEPNLATASLADLARLEEGLQQQFEERCFQIRGRLGDLKPLYPGTSFSLPDLYPVTRYVVEEVGFNPEIAQKVEIEYSSSHNPRFDLSWNKRTPSVYGQPPRRILEIFPFEYGTAINWIFELSIITRDNNRGFLNDYVPSSIIQSSNNPEEGVVAKAAYDKIMGQSAFIKLAFIEELIRLVEQAGSF